MTNETIFSKIIRGEIPSIKLFENEHVIAIKDIHPIAPVHILIITKKVIPNFQSLSKEDAYLLGEVAEVAKTLAKEYGIEEGYRLLTNNGSAAGQTISHLHFHLIGGRFLGPMA